MNSRLTCWPLNRVAKKHTCLLSSVFLLLSPHENIYFKGCDAERRKTTTTTKSLARERTC